MNLILNQERMAMLYALRLSTHLIEVVEEYKHRDMTRKLLEFKQLIFERMAETRKETQHDTVVD